ncbi:glycosyltransferase family 4 protein [Pectobacterium brasiliense]|uniref:glycosyltransferase family 4 protein n=1 Tax=Pectobacterium brasiliense TaxID=180957 RepID=UPI001D0D52FE|nr:glycosyltransferase family 1 protein [Pectobacterium brasiliense]UDQ77214.1 glycosyltransferase family 4 protein [Pectobacterium brasiliense]
MIIEFDGIITDLQKMGGVSVYFSELLNRLIKENCFQMKYNSYSESLLLKNIEFSPNVSVKYQDKRILERYRRCPVESLDKIFHSTYYRLPDKRSRVVTTVHDFTYEKFVRGPALWVHRWQKNKAIKNSDLVICVSHNTASDLLRYSPISDEKIRIIHNGVSENYHPLPQRATINNEVLFVGARAGYKNFDLAVRVIAGLPELSLSVVGGGDFSERERRLLNELIPGRYKWLGRLSDAQLNVEYNRAYALLYPSSYEGFGIPVLEAMKAGCPVVAVNASSIPEVAGDAAFLTESVRSSEFIEGLKYVDLNRESLKNRGFLQASKFSWNKCYQETLGVYKELM